jgi:vanillate O-demethylase monooxygenase subunit
MVETLRAGGIRNAWYVAAHSSELKDKPLARTVLGTSIVLYRKRDAFPAALRNACGHRLAPLSLGRVVEDTLQCAYHGAMFDETGRCIAFPGEREIPKRCAVTSYPLIERYGFLWVWPGRPGLANESSVPKIFSRSDDPAWTSMDGQFISFQAHYSLVLDNLFDSTHAQFVHPTTLGARGLLAQRGHASGESTFQADVGERAIRYVVDIRNGEAGPCLHEGLGRRLGNGPYLEPVDWYLDISWEAPSFFVFDSTTKPAGEDERRSVRFCTFHALTPETETSCNYFYRTVERLDEDQEPLCDFWHRATSTAFQEDKVVLEAQQAVIGARKPFDHDSWGVFQGDSLGMAARSILKRMEVGET